MHLDRLGGCLKRCHPPVVAERTKLVCCPHHLSFPFNKPVSGLCEGALRSRESDTAAVENKWFSFCFYSLSKQSQCPPFGVHTPRVARFVVAKTTLHGKRLEHRPEHNLASGEANPEGHDRGLLYPPASIEYILGVRQGAVAQQRQDRLLRWQELHRQVLRQLG